MEDNKISNKNIDGKSLKEILRFGNSKKKVWFFCASFVLFIMLTIVGCYILKDDEKLSISSAENSKENDWITSKDRINFLLLGADGKIGEEDELRTDTIILVSLDTHNKKISVLSIPRDTRVDILGYGENKINAANQLGGVSLVQESISNLLKVPIDYYVLTNFEGFKEIIDTLGGVEIDVEQNMKYRTYDGLIDLKKGKQRLDGNKALQYVRFRHDKLGDISRTQRQQKLLISLANEMKQVKNLIKLPILIPKVTEFVKTDLDIGKVISLVKDFENYDLHNITIKTLPGNFATINGISYWYVDKEKSHQVALDVFSGNTDDSIIDIGVKINDSKKEYISNTNKAQAKNVVSSKEVKESINSVNNSSPKSTTAKSEKVQQNENDFIPKIDEIDEKDSEIDNKVNIIEVENDGEQNTNKLDIPENDKDLNENIVQDNKEVVPEEENPKDSLNSADDAVSSEKLLNNEVEILEKEDTSSNNN